MREERTQPGTKVRNHAHAIRLTEGAWIQAAFRHIARNNVDDIRVEELARELGVTKGSFYWHFRNRQHLVERVLNHWMERATLQVTRWARAEETAGADSLRRLLSLPATTPPDKHGADVEIAIRSWARREELAARTVREVDAIRRDFFVELMTELGFSGEDAQRRAAAAQSFMLGEALLHKETGRDERLAIVGAFADLISAAKPRS